MVKKSPCIIWAVRRADVLFKIFSVYNVFVCGYKVYNTNV